MDTSSDGPPDQNRPALMSDLAFLGSSALLFLASATGTIYWIRSMTGGMGMAGQNPVEAAGAFVGLWLLMMTAMMLPSLVPTLMRYRRSLRTAETIRLGGPTVIAGAGYFFAWTVFGALAYLLTLLIAMAEMQWMAPAVLALLSTGAVLLLAGGYQFTPWKTRQVACCRNSSVDGQSGPPGLRRDLRHGLILGGHCILCCLGFMAILLVTGMTGLSIMIAVAVAITIERLLPKPLIFVRAIGVCLLLAGILVTARALGLA